MSAERMPDASDPLPIDAGQAGRQQVDRTEVVDDRLHRAADVPVFRRELVLVFAEARIVRSQGHKAPLRQFERVVQVRIPREERGSSFPIAVVWCRQRIPARLSSAGFSGSLPGV